MKPRNSDGPEDPKLQEIVYVTDAVPDGVTPPPLASLTAELTAESSLGHTDHQAEPGRSDRSEERASNVSEWKEESPQQKPQQEAAPDGKGTTLVGQATKKLMDKLPRARFVGQDNEDEKDENSYPVARSLKFVRQATQRFVEVFNPSDKLAKQTSQVLADIKEQAKEEEDLDAEQLTKQFIPWYIVKPTSRFKFCYDVSMLLILLFVAFYLPYRVSFILNDELLPLGLYIVEWGITAVFGLDIVINFFTGYNDIESGYVVIELPAIARSYLQGSFLLDFISTFPFDQVVQGGAGGAQRAGKLTRLPRLFKLLRVLRLLKLFRLARIKALVFNIETHLKLHQGVTRMTIVVATIIIITHTIGCLWSFIAWVDEYAETCQCMVSWNHYGSSCEVWFPSGTPSPLIDVNNCPWVWRMYYWSQPAGVRYVAGIYWALSTLATVGYGDISGRTEPEQLYCMVVEMIGVSWYAYFVSLLSTTINTFDAQSKAFQAKLADINAFARDVKLPSTLTKRILNHTEYMQHRNPWLSLGSSYDANGIMNELSPALRTEVILHVEKDVIDKLPFFKGKSNNFIAEFVMLFEPIRIEANDYLIHEGAAADEMYFLVRGTVAMVVMTDTGSMQYRLFFEGSYFGDLGCIVGNEYEYSIRTETACDMQVISKRNLVLILQVNTDVLTELQDSARNMRKRLSKFKERSLDEKVLAMKEEADDAKKVGVKLLSKKVQPRESVVGNPRMKRAHSLFMENMPNGVGKNGLLWRKGTSPALTKSNNVVGKSLSSNKSSAKSPQLKAKSSMLRPNALELKNLPGGEAKPELPGYSSESLLNIHSPMRDIKLLRQQSVSEILHCDAVHDSDDDNNSVHSHFELSNEPEAKYSREILDSKELEAELEKKIDEKLKEKLPEIEKYISDAIDRLTNAAATIP